MDALPTRSDPAREAAALLRRLGFAVLTVALPAAALLTRRAVVLLLPIGATLLVLAGMLDGTSRPSRATLARALSSIPAVSLAFGLAWAAVSLAWTPAPAASGERFGSLIGGVALALAAFLALPDRMRSSNLYLVPIGTAFAALLAIAILALRFGVVGPDDDGRNMERGVSVIVLFAWPSLAWLRSRGRDREAAGLAAAVAVAALLAPDATASVAFSVGALAYLATALSGRAGAAAIAVGAVLLLLFPAASVVLSRSGAPDPGSWRYAVETWADAMAVEPLRLVTGHGFGAFGRDRMMGSLPAGVPDTSFFQLWYELGLLGAVAAASALAAGPLAARESYGAILPGVVATFGTALALAAAGTGTGQAWWPGTIGIVLLLFVAVRRGQFRTRRPRAGPRGLNLAAASTKA